jgi:hypothetical protein
MSIRVPTICPTPESGLDMPALVPLDSTYGAVLIGAMVAIS